MRAYYGLRPGHVVSVRDERLNRWRRGIVRAVNIVQMEFAVQVGNVWIRNRLSPDYIRLVRLVYCRRCSEMRRAA